MATSRGAIRVRSTAGVPTSRRVKGPLNVYEKNAISRMLLEGKSVAAIADIIERTSDTVRKFVNSMSDTTHLATLTVKHRAVEVMGKVLDKGSTAELIDVLSRPNIGVLAPAEKPGSGGGKFDIQVSVGVASLGAMKAGVEISAGDGNVHEGKLLPTGDEGQGQ